MCSPHVDGGLLLEWVRKRGSVCPARKICEEESERAFVRPFVQPGKVIWVEWGKPSSLVENIKSKPQRSVAVTDLFPFANQYPRQAIRPHTDQSGTERIDSSFLSRTIFSNSFLVVEHSESSWLAAKIDLSRVLCYWHSTWNESLWETHIFEKYPLVDSMKLNVCAYKQISLGYCKLYTILWCYV